jgi:hypothetical protein
VVSHPRSTAVQVDVWIRLLKFLNRGDARAIYRTAITERIDFAALLIFLAREEMGPWVHATARERNVLALFGRPLAEDVARAQAAQRARNVDQIEAISLIGRVLGAQEIDFVLLKGLHVAGRFWGGIDRRFTADIDILVRPREAGSALELLDGAGFSRPVGRLVPYWAARFVHHALACRRGNVSVDVHWTFRTKPGIRLDMDDVWRTCLRQRIGEVECNVLGDPYTLLIMILGVAIDIERGLCRLRKLWDLYLLLDHLDGFDWPEFIAAREREGLLPLTVNVLALVLWRLDCHDEFPALAAELERHRGVLTVSDAGGAARILDGSPWRLRNHIWFARLQPAPTWYYGFWWAATLPLRYLVARDT